MRPAILKGAVWLPLERLPAPADIRRRLTVKRQTMGDETAQVIEAFSHLDDNYLEVPRQFGLDLCDTLGIEVLDQTSQGHPAHFPRLPTLRDYQVGPVAEIEAACGDFYDFLFQARTGFGKSASLIYVAGKRARTTLILVDQDNLKEQWIEALIQHAGFARDQIGIIQGDRCDYEGKAVTIAMVQTLSRRGTYAEILAYFGTLIVDETHTIGAPTFSMVLFDIPATARVGTSATPKRKDGTQALLEGHLGHVRVAADAEHDVSRVYIVKSYGTYSWYANVSSKVGRFINEITEDGARNLQLMEIVHWLYQTGRDVLVLSDRIEQLRHLLDLLWYMGVPEDDLGLYTGRDPHYRVAKDPTPTDDKPGTRAVPSRLQMISKAVPARVLEQVKATARVIGATYGKFQKGVDVPRLCGGADASPRSEAEQVHGRILRGGASKEPIWVTVVDWNSYRSVHGSIRRIQDYAKSNATIHEWLEEGGSQPCSVASYVAQARQRVAQLKQMEIQSHKDGRHRLYQPTAAEKLRLLQQGQAHRARQRARKGKSDDAPTPISASARRTRMTPTTERTASAPRGTATTVSAPSTPVRSRTGSRSRVPRGR